jgi:phytoene dehydrogenase-like protein
MENNNFDVIIVGSGIAGLTAAAFLAKDNHRVLLLEKDDSYGGLLGGFNVNGHWLDKGARGIIDSGIIFPMLRQLGLTIEFTDNPIKMTFGQESMDFINKDSITDYELLLKKIFPEESKNIEAILNDVRLIMTHMDVLYGIENPLFLPKPYDLNYVSKTLLPWMFKFIIHIRKAMKFMQPVDEYLKTKTSNQSLIDLISQHFFAKTPTFFALSYFTLYLEYHYPKGSTQSFINVFVDFLNQHDVVLKKQAELVSYSPR